MAVRTHHRHDAADRAFRTVEDGQGNQRHTMLSSDALTDEASPFEFFAALTVAGGGWDHLGLVPDNGDPAEPWIARGDGSWLCHTTGTDGTHTIWQGGPSRLWDRIETAHQQWHQLGQPARERFGLTIRQRTTHDLARPPHGSHY